jgi:hypothetical protein
MKSFMMPKIVKLSKNITPFAGISYVNAGFTRSGLAQLIDNELGARRKEAKYSYSDIFRTGAIFFIVGANAPKMFRYIYALLWSKYPAIRP